ncbi:hypothetical protein ACFXHA_26090 [Nocardia sp. NPDC059240]|uniref:hypothetical protein n=1 Tax=Nocardia sp. NPDC059240 TaxID=3346786 RepID=UPI0036CDF902
MKERDHRAGSRSAPIRLDELEDYLQRLSIYCQHLDRETLPKMHFDIDRLFSDIARLSSEFAEMNARVTVILANQHRSEQPDATTTDHLGHYEISHQLRSFVEQDLRRAVAQLLPSGSPSIDRAHLISRCAAALFKYPEIDRAAVEKIFGSASTDTAQLEYDLLQRATEIRQAAADLGHDHRWEFGHEPGTPLDADTQEPWGVCDPDEPIAFVVVPAYYVAHRLLLKQQVVTGVISAASDAPEPVRR